MGDSYLQLITVLLIFVVVLAVTAFMTRWIAGYQKQQGILSNIEVIETTRISNNKYIQLVRIGETYMAIAVCRDTVTLLGEIPKEQVAQNTGTGGSASFRELFDKLMKKDANDDSGNAKEPKE